MLQQSTGANPSNEGHQQHNKRPESAIKCNAMNSFNVGSRKSNLALIQTRKVIDELTKAYERENKTNSPLETFNKTNRYNFEIVPMTTTGDNIQHRSLPTIGAKSLFTRELETALLDDEIDFIVHSLKDLPTTLPEGCIIGAILPRDDVNDVIVLKSSLQNRVDPLSLLQGTYEDCVKIGTSSQRRIALLKRCNHNIECIDIRGNLNTRFRKLDDTNGEYKAIVLAAAGLDRMNMSERASLRMDTINNSRLSEIKWPYAVGQGAIAVECRKSDKKILNLLRPVVCLKTTYEAAAERAMMKYLEGGCSVPMGVRCRWINEYTLELTGAVLSLDGQKLVECSSNRDLSISEDIPLVNELSDLTGIVIVGEHNSPCHLRLTASVRLGYEVAVKMLAEGAKSILDSARRHESS